MHVAVVVGPWHPSWHCHFRRAMTQASLTSAPCLWAAIRMQERGTRLRVGQSAAFCEGQMRISSSTSTAFASPTTPCSTRFLSADICSEGRAIFVACDQGRFRESLLSLNRSANMLGMLSSCFMVWAVLMQKIRLVKLRLFYLLRLVAEKCCCSRCATRTWRHK